MWLMRRAWGKVLGRFCISQLGSMRGGPEILELGKHSLET
jgi:hypothetical protein